MQVPDEPFFVRDFKQERRDFFTSIRIAVIGSTVSEPIGQLLSVVGKDEVLRRIRLMGILGEMWRVQHAIRQWRESPDPLWPADFMVGRKEA